MRDKYVEKESDRGTDERGRGMEEAGREGGRGK